MRDFVRPPFVLKGVGGEDEVRCEWREQDKVCIVEEGRGVAERR